MRRRDERQLLLCKHKGPSAVDWANDEITDIKASLEWQGFSWQNENPILSNCLGPLLPRNTLIWPKASYS